MRVSEVSPSPSERVSVIVPVLGWSKTLEDTLGKLVADPHPAKEIIVAIDEPTEKSMELVERFGRDVRFKLSDRRRGKVRAIDDCYSSSSGDVLIFLDSDIVIKTPDLISRTASQIRGFDMLEMKKGVVIEGLLSNIIYYEYVGFNAANWMMARRMKKTLGVNGAGFAITREAYARIGGFKAVISEDLDLGLRAYLHDLSFKYADDIQVDTFAPPTLKRWWAQRKRWAYGTSVWFHDNYRPLFSALKRHPGILGTALIMIFPAVLSALFGLTFKNVAAIDLFALLMLTLSSRSFPIFIPAFIPYGALPNLFSIGLSLLVGLMGYSFVYLYFTRRLGYHFNPVYFLLYYIVYSPVWFVAMVWGLITVFVRKETVDIDWKI
ncbi:MAG TPA: glycosyltransferase family 2 protein [Conexivisphaerales archaeon]|nr:glycosyltransferase family 2 protein [Conexivisphaerales archaeon]